MTSELHQLRQQLLDDLKLLQTVIDINLDCIEDGAVKNVLMALLDRQDKLFEFYISRRDDLIQKSLPKPIKNSFTEYLELLV